jgi:hypothetical protein
MTGSPVAVKGFPSTLIPGEPKPPPNGIARDRLRDLLVRFDMPPCNRSARNDSRPLCTKFVTAT